jgi:hypothetical protein
VGSEFAEKHYGPPTSAGCGKIAALDSQADQYVIVNRPEKQARLWIFP